MRLTLALLLALPALAFASLEWKKTVIEYQAKSTEDSVTAVYHFINAGQTPIRILSTKSSCGCTVVEQEKELYEPGEMGALKAKFTFDGRTGHQEKRITVYTDDNMRPIDTLALNVDIPEFLNVEPELLFWSTGEAPKPKSVIVTVMADVDVHIKQALSASENFTVELTTLQEGRQYGVTVTPKDTTSAVQSQVTLITDVGSDEHPRKAFVVLKIY